MGSWSRQLRYRRPPQCYTGLPPLRPCLHEHDAEDRHRALGIRRPTAYAAKCEADYDELVAALDELLGEIKGDGDHPLGGLAACMGTVISAYDQVHYPLLTTPGSGHSL
ncbi:hypothetical protein Q024_06505 [Pseudomonas aeruginosa BWHPSA011]|nr:hypothetical protein Q024_06505 [Pseudomonas aeruginosa BWHPSA011]ETV28910.1 hypothetical protein Q046_05827 [Pseudomonas aeruginosa BWHPSA041]ETV55825.1 hypothetical protein Q042_05234 [Pseudomonas aeruginosa BWHPSA037]BDF97418.1 hypothetical protein [Pseudomonas aeruginosa]